MHVTPLQLQEDLDIAFHMGQSGACSVLVMLRLNYSNLFLESLPLWATKTLPVILNAAA